MQAPQMQMQAPQMQIPQMQMPQMQTPQHMPTVVPARNIRGGVYGSRNHIPAIHPE